MRHTLRLGPRLVQSIIKSPIQRGSIDLNGVTSATATIKAVNVNHTVLHYLGRGAGSTSTSSPDVHNARIELTNATTVTAFRNTSDANALVVDFEVVEYWRGVIRSIQRDTFTGNGTDTITAVNTTKAQVMPLGMTSSDTSTDINVEAHVTLTNATTVTIASGAGSTVGYQVVEWN